MTWHTSGGILLHMAADLCAVGWIWLSYWLGSVCSPNYLGDWKQGRKPSWFHCWDGRLRPEGLWLYRWLHLRPVGCHQWCQEWPSKQSTGIQRAVLTPYRFHFCICMVCFATAPRFVNSDHHHGFQDRYCADQITFLSTSWFWILCFAFELLSWHWIKEYSG